MTPDGALLEGYAAGPPDGRGREARARPIAFFDVDETLITAKSMFAFWDHWVAGRPDTAHAVADLSPAAPRADRNRAHFRRYAGVPLAELRSAAHDWYAAYRTGRSPFVTAAVDALRRHRAAGHAVVLVSGSVRPILEPVALDLCADATLCTELLVSPDGLLTGEVRQPMIGAAKGEAVATLLKRYGTPAEECYGYGDHASDLALLQAVGHPCVVGDDPRLVEHAERGGWLRLPATGGRQDTARGPRSAD